MSSMSRTKNATHVALDELLVIIIMLLLHYNNVIITLEDEYSLMRFLHKCVTCFLLLKYLYLYLYASY